MAPPAEQRRRTLAHVPALDGLRAVAVIGVMLFHGGVSWMPGGFLGVDVFFVLSGYLITTLLLRERVLSGRIDLRAFWIRRFRRLLPALLVLLAGVSIAAPFLGDPAQRAQLRGDGIAALLYVANWRFILTDQSYFAGTPSPLRHLWSLSVEEQWYVVFPLVAALALGHMRRRRLQAFTAGLAVAALASAAWMAHLASGPGDPSRAYYGTDTRAHSLLVGALLACVAVLVPLHRFRRVLAVAGAVGAGLVVLAYLTVAEGDAWMYRGGFLGLALATAALVAAIALPRPGLPLVGLLAVRPLVAIGQVSYGLYLWHWPVNVFLTPQRTHLDAGTLADDVALFALRTSVAVVLTVASYRLIEAPTRAGGVDGLRLRFPGVGRSRPATVAVATGLVVWLLVAATLRVPDGGGQQTVAGLPPELAGQPAGVPDMPDTTVATIPAEIRRVVESEGLPPVPDDRPVRVLVVGDSVALTLSWNDPPVPETLEVTTRAILGCGLVDGFALTGGVVNTSAQACGDWPAFWQGGVAAAQPDVVMVQYGAWEVYDHKVGADVLESPSPEMAEAMRAGFDQGVEAVLEVKPDVRFAFVGPPCMQEQNPRLGGADSERNDPEKVAWVNEVIEGYADDLGPRAEFLPLGDLLCPDGEFVEAPFGGGELRPDGSHFAGPETGPVWDWLADRIIPFARTPVGGPDAATDLSGDVAAGQPADPAEDPPA